MRYSNLSNFIDGKSSNPGVPRMERYSPVDGELLSSLPLSDAKELDKAVQAAKKAFADWSQWTIKERTGVFYKYYELLSKRLPEIADIQYHEMGKIPAEALQEVGKSLELTEVACSMPQMATGDFEEVSRGVECHDVRVPLGVVASITPFNFPHMVPHWTLPNALVLGNTMILKPSREAPYTVLKIGEMMKEAGLPDGVLNIVCGGREVVNAIVEHPNIQGITFVGSTKVAQMVYAKGCANFKRVLALGSANNHLILLPDAHPANSAANIAASYLGCAGQRCMSACVLVAVGDVDPIIAKLVEESKKFVPGVNMSAIVNTEAKANIIGYIDRAEKDGANILLDGRGAKPPAGKEKGQYLGPTIIEAKAGSEIAMEENFGPILTIVRARTLDEALDIANSSPYGNGGSIFTQSGRAAEIFCKKIQAGMVAVNVGVPVPREPFSFGGWKNSIVGGGDITGKSSFGFWTKLKKISVKWNPDKPVNWMA
ncbi:MAG TPA: CoA-acylating methylmalonate-semialdehyde dehydrogenase [Kiritimatiellia bacterium]|nr:CoA-acylating methylmalonate-semialdehyde dehydrogenase [Kiritimatiellia bacterium]HRZ12459.1 CoA-acylating methylmalonate-semialdehyde dehydrogenase [Kiritimatiellia bacterium]HSA17783.1 CoA-acylating methylmalonate-semialdehyde dehydrogenase [Kiritimatiellia bacterium]